MTFDSQHSAPPALTPVQWLICFVAAMGFAFDSYELLMLPLIIRPALSDLLGVAPDSLEVNAWVGTMLYVPAVAGGIFGLLGGYLTDLFGRRRVLVWSILLYGFSAMAAGYATSVQWLLFFRCTTFVGVCVEFVAAVAWLAEMFPDAKQRERVIGYTQAFGSIGGLMVTGVYFLVVTYAESLPEVLGGHAAWRYTLISGLIPAIPLMIIRPFLPESPTWRAKKLAGTLRRPKLRRVVYARVPAHDDRDDDHDGLCVRGGVRRHSADAAHRARPGGCCRTLENRAGTDHQRCAVVPGRSADSLADSCWRFSPW